MNQFLSKSLIKWAIIPFVLFLFWLIATFLWIIGVDKGFSVLTYNHNKSEILNYQTNKLFKGDKIKGEIRAKENYFGAIIIGFQDLNNVDFKKEDILNFKIKEKGTKKWYYKNNYRSGLIYGDPLFPIGFPIINNSKGKIYDFEFVSLSGTEENAVALRETGSILKSQYQFPKSKILSPKDGLFSFLYLKFTTTLSDPDFANSSASIFSLFF